MFSLKTNAQTIATNLLYWPDSYQGLSPYYENNSESQVEQIIDNSIYSVDWKCYLQEFKFQLKNGNEVLVSFFSDTTILYREMHEGEIICQGELEKDFARPYTYETRNDSTGLIESIDTNYFFSQKGNWLLNQTKDQYEFGKIENGVKNGKWEVRNRHVNDLPLYTLTYDKGKLIDSTQIDFSKCKDIEKYLTKHWVNCGMNIDKEIGYRHIAYVSNDSLKFYFGWQANYSYKKFTLSRNHSMVGERIMNCGTTKYQDSFLRPKGKWHVEAIEGGGNKIIFEEEDGTEEDIIEYLSESILIMY